MTFLDDLQRPRTRTSPNCTGQELCENHCFVRRHQKQKPASSAQENECHLLISLPWLQLQLQLATRLLSQVQASEIRALADPDLPCQRRESSQPHPHLVFFLP